MKTIIDLIADEVKQAFVDKGFEEKYGMVTVSNRPDLCNRLSVMVGCADSCVG